MRFPVLACPLLILLQTSLLSQTFTDASNLLDPNTDLNTATGASAVDFNNDGLIDIYRPGHLYLNQGNAGFKDILFETEMIEGESVFGAAFGDYNGDGYPDVVFEDLGAPSRAYQNKGNLAFAHINEPANLDIKTLAQGAGWCDYNLDGRLDLYVNNDDGENQLFQNVGDGQFIDISLIADLNRPGNSYGMSWGDYNNDGFPDIFNATCSADPARSIKHLFRNNGDGSFTNVNVQAGVADSLGSWSVNWFDYDNDGYLDIYIGNIDHLPRTGKNKLYHNNGNGTFTDRAELAGVAGLERERTFGSAVADFDNDGWPDIYVANSGSSHRLYRNNGDGTFSDIADVAGISERFHSNVAVADFNGDGWVDIFTAGNQNNLLYNNGGSNHWLRVYTRAGGDNYDGIGSRVEVVTGSLRQIREVRAGDGFCSQNHALSVHFGLGSETVADSVIIRWPGGQVERLSDVTVDQEITAVRGVGINNPPDTFTLIEPANEQVLGSPTSPVRFSWQATADPETDALDYTLLLAGPEFESAIAVGADTEVLVEAALFNENRICSWTVNVSDGFSVVASSEVFSFADAACSEDQLFEPLAGINNAISGRYRAGSWADFDDDGFQDLFLTANNAIDLFRNNAGQSFSLTNAGELGFNSGTWRTSAWADFDNDGDEDLFVANATGTDNLFENRNGSFILLPNSVGSEVEATTLACSWLDIDNDGFVDLFTANLDEGPNALYHNNGDGTFEKILEGELAEQATTAFSIACADVENDGDTDIYLVSGSRNFLFLNDGAGSFQRVTEGQIAERIESSFTASWGDYDNDGDPDLFIGRQSGYESLLYKNNGAVMFELVESGELTNTTDFAQSSSWVDFDNDGLLDLFVGYGAYSLLYKNQGTGLFKGLFSDRTRSEGAEASVWADYDNDGDMDLVSVDRAATFFTNTGNANHWAVVTCRGTNSNMSAIGAKVRILATIENDTVWQLREIAGQTGHYSQNSHQVHFGLGDASRIDSLIVEWPSGHIDRFADLAVDRFLSVIEGQQITSIDLPAQAPENFALNQNFPNPFNPETTISYVLPETQQLKIAIFNALGQEVRVLIDAEQQAGIYKVIWDGKNNAGVTLSSGVYFYRLFGETQVQSRRMVLLR